MKHFLAPILIIMSTSMAAQSIKTDSISKAKISKLAFIVGKWEGSGWMMRAESGKSTFNQTENIQFKLDSTAILIEGRGMVDGKTVHDAMAILTYDEKEGKFSFRSFLSNGSNSAFPADLIDNRFYWYPNDDVRYIIWLNQNGKWQETGEFKKDGQWNQFFEMVLNRIE